MEKGLGMTHLRYNHDEGIAEQDDKEKPIKYNVKYYHKLNNYRKDPIKHDRINQARVELVNEYIPRWKKVLDFGCGNGDFMTAVNKTHILIYGYDVMPDAIKNLKSEKAYLNPYQDDIRGISGVCMWDVLEHLSEPKEILEIIPKGAYLFMSIPIFETLHDIKKSHHYRPNEHFWYFTHNGILAYMDMFKLLEYNDIETDLGREGIRTYVFRKQ
jgi:2-polyprenyl-3-methyl-5-hydroxy-6-metoxy-1,4-benzoquinol methylase